MSFCPTKDIHSVYLDNELPEAYKAEYEAHVKNCPKCKKELDQLRALRFLFSEDAKSIVPDSKLEDSYDRLMIKMAYRKNTEKARKEVKKPAYFALAAAAAAVFALIIPVRVTGAGEVASPAGGAVASVPSAQVISPISSSTAVATSASNVSLGSGKTVPVSGNIHETLLSSNIQAADNSDFTDPVIRADILRPDINEGKGISIKITVPGMNNAPVVTEINFPRHVISGNY